MIQRFRLDQRYRPKLMHPDLQRRRNPLGGRRHRPASSTHAHPSHIDTIDSWAEYIYRKYSR